jgi:hypothetical protein
MVKCFNPIHYISFYLWLLKPKFFCLPINDTITSARVDSHARGMLTGDQRCKIEPWPGEVYSIYYVIKFFGDLRKVCVFFLGTPFSSTNKTERQDITEILLIVA